MSNEEKTPARRVRTRARQVVGAADAAVTEKPVTANVTTAMRDEARKAYEGNQLKNRGTREEKKARDKLYGLMAGATPPITSFELTTPIGEGKDQRTVTLDARIEAPSKDVIDVVKLFDKVGKDAFLRIVTASAAAVTKEVGSAIAEQCKVTQKGTEAAKVTLRK